MSTTSITGAYLEELTGFEPALMVLQTTSLTCLDTTPPERWLGCLGSNQKSRSQSPLPYRLATS